MTPSLLPFDYELSFTGKPLKISMGEPNLKRNHTGPHLSAPNPAEPKPDGNVEIELSTELIMELRDNAYNGTKTDDVHPISRDSKTNGAYDRECHLKFMSWLSLKFKNPRKLSSATKNALWKFWEKGYDNDTLIHDEESRDDESDNSDQRPFFDPYQNDDDEGDIRNQMMHDSCTSENFDAPHSDNNEQNEGMCRVDKFEVVKHSVGNNEEFLCARIIERNS
ncbi:hypothetical protein Tco_0840136 [Tanacetum coccineum]|uniref:Uncharacterized protein n=1 Tax=Tanacetum coccineum TaxID=301880 RepID=A0ABQ5AUJ8_9ASTR